MNKKKVHRPARGAGGFKLGEYGAIKVSPVYFHPDPEDDSSLSPPKGIYFAENKRTTFSRPVTDGTEGEVFSPALPREALPVRRKVEWMSITDKIMSLELEGYDFCNGTLEVEKKRSRVDVVADRDFAETAHDGTVRRASTRR